MTKGEWKKLNPTRGRDCPQCKDKVVTLVIDDTRVICVKKQHVFEPAGGINA